MSRNDYKEGFGVVDDDGLDLRTVSPTERAAKINWLVTRAARRISSSTTDEQIETMWAEECRNALVRPVRVYVQ